jgi:hypothetical protein
MVRGMSQPFPDYCFKDTALGDPNRRNRVMRADLIGKCIPRDRRECYTTWARFNQEFADYCEEKGSVKRYTGPAFADFLWLDVDSKDAEGNPNPTVAHDGAIRLVLNLLAKAGVAEADLRIYFSGRQGFPHRHPGTQTFGVEPSEHLPRGVQNPGQAPRGAGPNVTIDGAVYDTTRLWRLPNTVNGKTGLYKIAAHLGRLRGRRGRSGRWPNSPATGENTQPAQRPTE